MTKHLEHPALPDHQPSVGQSDVAVVEVMWPRRQKPMHYFKRDPKTGKLVEYHVPEFPERRRRRRGIDLVMESLCDAMPLKRPMTAREIEHSQRIERMRAAGTLPSREEFARMVDDVMGKILLRRLPLATKKIQ